MPKSSLISVGISMVMFCRDRPADAMQEAFYRGAFRACLYYARRGRGVYFTPGLRMVFLAVPVVFAEG